MVLLLHNISTARENLLFLICDDQTERARWWRDASLLWQFEDGAAAAALMEDGY